jgi:hypothetical protein
MTSKGFNGKRLYEEAKAGSKYSLEDAYKK